jgi:ATP-dependent RNA helicase DDX21
LFCCVSWFVAYISVSGYFQALHGDVGQKQRDSTLAAFRAGAFNVLVATDVAARGIDIQDVDLVVQFDPPRDVDTYVHRSGRTGRAGNKGVSVLLFNAQQQRDIVRIERDLGHNFKFDLSGPPSIEAALRAAAKTSAIACSGIPDETAQYFKDSAAALLASEESAEDVVARCLAAISRRSTEVLSRSLISGELGMATVEMTNTRGRPVSPGDVMFTVGKLSRMSRREGEVAFDSDIGKIQAKPESGVAVFDMGVSFGWSNAIPCVIPIFIRR